jgi:two-component system, NarL family, response regulator NreC
VTRARVLIADDHTIVRHGLVGILNATDDIEVVGQAGNGAEAVNRAIDLKPDIVLLDISMPRLNGLEAARRIHKALPSSHILVLTMHEDEEYVLKMVRAGVSGYIVKDGAVSELIAAIRAVKSGKTWFGPQASQALADAWQDGAALPDDPLERLTNREREVLLLIIEGKTNSQVSETLGVSPKTVDNHRTRLMEKLGVHNTAELVRFAARHGLLV